MTHETYCADQLRLIEKEQFIAIGDEHVARTLNPAYDVDLRNGRAERLPDLLSIKREGGETLFRLREVKFKLEDRLVRKALTQLASGIERLRQSMTSPIIDRVEIVVALQGRALKVPEREFLGEALASNRYRLKLGEPLPLRVERLSCPVTVLLL